MPRSSTPRAATRRCAATSRSSPTPATPSTASPSSSSARPIARAAASSRPRPRARRSRAGAFPRAIALARTALERNPSHAEALAIAERASEKLGRRNEMSPIYDYAARGALGRFGRRAAHHRAARFFEAHAPMLALKHAAQAFIAVPSEGTTLALARAHGRSRAAPHGGRAHGRARRRAGAHARASARRGSSAPRRSRRAISRARASASISSSRPPSCRRTR